MVKVGVEEVSGKWVGQVREEAVRGSEWEEAWIVMQMSDPQGRLLGVRMGVVENEVRGQGTKGSV